MTPPTRDLPPHADDVRKGLTATPKTLPPYLFYDTEGSRLFVAITELEEYYPTRLERDLFRKHADEMVAAASDDEPLVLIELGAGVADKTRELLKAVLERQDRVPFYPIDVSAGALEEAERSITAGLDRVDVTPVVGLYEEAMARLQDVKGRKLVLFIGSSVGNFEPEDALRLLTGVRERMGPGDALLLGTDMRKDPDIMIPAYDDDKGVTKAFNQNALVRINNELGADFDLDAFEHLALWNAEQGRMEMHLRSTRDQTVHIDALDLDVHLRQGETIHTENSYKFNEEEVRQLIEGAGFVLERSWYDDERGFGEHLARVPDA